MNKHILIIVSCMLVQACTNYMFQPSRALQPLPAELNIVYQDFFVDVQDGLKLNGWYLPARGHAKKTLLFFHGNALNVSNHVAAIYWLPQFGYEIYMIDYRGYGRSEGEAELQSVIADFDTVIAFTLDRIGPDRKLIIMGQSLGASMGIYALSQTKYKDRISAYISVAAFSDYRSETRDVLAQHWLTWLFQWPLSFTVNNDYRPLNFVDSISPVPIHILHGTQDDIIPVYHAEALFSAARQPKSLTLLKGGHNDLFFYKHNREAILRILDKL